MFVNGSRVGTNASFSSTADFSSAFINRYFESAAGYLNGYMSNFRVVKGTAVYDPTLTTLTVPTAPVTNVTNTSLLLNMTNAGIYDAAVQNVITTVSNAQASTTPTAQFPPTSMKFNGSTDYLLLPANPAFTLGTGDFTIELWIYPNSSVGTQGIVGISATATAGDLGIFYNFAGATNKVTLNCAGGTAATSTASAPTGQWTYVAFSRTSGSLKIYINGALDKTVSYADNFNKATLVVGRSYASLNQEYFNGSIQDLRITKGVGRTITASPTAPFPTR